MVKFYLFSTVFLAAGLSSSAAAPLDGDVMRIKTRVNGNTDQVRVITRARDGFRRGRDKPSIYEMGDTCSSKKDLSDDFLGGSIDTPDNCCKKPSLEGFHVWEERIDYTLPAGNSVLLQDKMNKNAGCFKRFDGNNPDNFNFAGIEPFNVYMVQAYEPNKAIPTKGDYMVEFHGQDVVGLIWDSTSLNLSDQYFAPGGVDTYQDVSNTAWRGFEHWSYEGFELSCGCTDPPTPTPSKAPITPAPSKAPITPAPSKAPITPAPSKAPITPAPSKAPITPAPSKAPITPAPSEAPITPAPSKAPITPAPSEAPITPAPSKAPTPGSGGDPHFKTWRNEHFEFHGQCDLVMTRVKNFVDGMDLDIHIRTKMVRYWSYIQKAVIRIGNDILEVEGSTDGDYYRHYRINFEYRGDLSTIKLGGLFPVSISPRKNKYTIDLDSEYPGQKIEVKTFKEFVSVRIVGATAESFGNSVGIIGDFNTGKTLARDGTTVLHDFNDLGLEWQVLPSDGFFFSDLTKPQFPELCYLPEDPRGVRTRRLSESDITEEAAETACGRLQDEMDRKDCIYDILATQDMDMVGAY